MMVRQENDDGQMINIQPKNKKSIRRVMGALKPHTSIDVDKAIEQAKLERAKHIAASRSC